MLLTVWFREDGVETIRKKKKTLLDSRPRVVGVRQSPSRETSIAGRTDGT